MKWNTHVVLLHIAMFLSAAIAQSVKSELATQRGLPGPFHHYLASQEDHHEAICGGNSIKTIVKFDDDYYSLKM